MQKQKKKFEVFEHESVEECLNRMKVEGYSPIKRIEKPIFKEEKKGKRAEPKYYRQIIMFEGIKE